MAAYPLPANAGDGPEALRAEAIRLVERGECARGEDLLRRAVNLAPGRVEGLRDLGVTLAAQGRWQEAAGVFRQACRLAPRDSGLMGELGRALLEGGDNAGAVPILRAARAISPRDPSLAYRLAKAMWRLGERDEVCRLLERCLRLDPEFEPALRLLGECHHHRGHAHRAREPLLRYLRLRPGDHGAKALAANVHWSCGELEDCLSLTRELLATSAMPPSFHSTHLSVLLHRPGETAETLRAAAAEWGRKAKPDAGPAPRGFSDPEPGPERKLRVGYLTHEFTSGPAIHFILPLLIHSDRNAIELFAYHANPVSDKWTRRARRLVQNWRALNAHADLAQAVAADRIDILVDVSGHYGSHLSFFQGRHAPIQITFPDYPGTTGAAEIDYILTDNWVCPPGLERQYTEKAIKLPAGYLPYRPPVSPRVTPLPALRTGAVTFAMFQRPAKMNAGVWDAMARILLAVPGSTLLIHYFAAELDDATSPARRRFGGELESRGVAAGRLRYRGHASLADHLALFDQVDIALDTFPYNGQTTTCECLWMGVPVVTLRGEIHTGRVGFEILDRAGLGHLAASSVDEYVATAVALAGDLGALAAMRRKLRAMLRHSPIVDGSVVKGIENAYREVWKKWRRQPLVRKHRKS